MLIILFFPFLLIKLPKSSKHLHKYITCKQQKKYSVCYLVCIAFIKFIVMEHVQLRLTYIYCCI